MPNDIRERLFKRFTPRELNIRLETEECEPRSLLYMIESKRWLKLEIRHMDVNDYGIFVFHDIARYGSLIATRLATSTTRENLDRQTMHAVRMVLSDQSFGRR